MIGLDEQAAKIMGWEIGLYPKLMHDPEYWGEPVWMKDNGYDELTIQVIPYEKFLVKEWFPSTRWDHAGILIEWTEKHERPIEIGYVNAEDSKDYKDIRYCGFVGPDWNPVEFEFLSPQVITQAFVAAFGGEK